MNKKTEDRTQETEGKRLVVSCCLLFPVFYLLTFIHPSAFIFSFAPLPFFIQVGGAMLKFRFAEQEI